MLGNSSLTSSTGAGYEVGKACARQGNDFEEILGLGSQFEDQKESLGTTDQKLGQLSEWAHLDRMLVIIAPSGGQPTSQEKW